MTSPMDELAPNFDDIPLPPEPPKMPVTQAERIIRKFGGAARLTRILKAVGRPYNRTTIYRWRYPKNKGGTAGQVPAQAWPDILEAARLEGILLTSEDLDPRELFLNPNAYPELIRKRYGSKGHDLA